MPKKKTTVRLPEELYGRLQELAKRERRTAAAELLIALEAHLDRREAALGRPDPDRRPGGRG